MVIQRFLKIICDENIPIIITQQLVLLGYDAQHFASINPGYTDQQLAGYCHTHKAILITQDKDFGVMVYFDKISILPLSILFCRVASFAERDEILHQITKILARPELLKHQFITITTKQIKSRGYGIDTYG